MSNKDRFGMTGGCEQGDRHPLALDTGYFNADELSFPDLLSMGAELGAKLNFYDLNYTRAGNWLELFSNDETAVMAMILSKDLKRLEAEFQIRHAMSRDGLDLARYLVRLAGMVDFWFRKFSAMESAPARKLSWQIAAVVEQKLAAELHSLTEHGPTPPPHDTHGGADPFAGLHAIWHPGKKGDAPASGMPRAGVPRHDPRAAFYSFLNALSYLKKAAAGLIGETLATGSHQPAIALFIAFLKLYGKVQDKINRFQERHLDFYYRRVLHFTPRPAVADAAHLLFSAGAGGAFIPAGAEFAAGKDENGNEILFQADNSLLVTDVRVESLRTLFFERDPLISPERELNYVTRVHADAFPPAAKAGEPARPFFGEAGRGTARAAAGAAAELGFALATRVLLLREGRRSVGVTVYFTSQSTSEEEIRRAVADLCGKHAREESFFNLFGLVFSRYLLADRETLSREDKEAILEKARLLPDSGAIEVIGDLLRRDRRDLFFTLMPKIFSVALTGENGWHEVSGVEVRPVAKDGRKSRDGLGFSFVLGPEAPPIVPYSAGLHGGGYDTRLPVIRFRLNESASFFPYSLFAGIAVKEFLVETSVRGVTQLFASNNHGQLDPSMPFAPFGPLPTDNSYLIVGNYEAAAKPLTEFKLNIEWAGLPRERDGFREYYEGYGTDYTNRSFSAEVSFLRDGGWFAGSAATLFDTVPGSGRVSPDKVIRVDGLAHFKPLPPAFPEDAYQYDPRARAGFFKIALTGPEGAFGHGEYPALLMAALSANAGKKNKELLAVPNAPYTPQINRITLDYEARRTIAAGIGPAEATDEYRDKTFHIHPFGVEPVIARGDLRFHHLLPPWLYDGNLFIGLGGEKPEGILTLFFHLREDPGLARTAGPPEIAWFFLASNRWRRLSASRILSDTTESFQTSGIVTLDIPEKIGKRNSIMPEDLYWLRVAVGRNVGAFGVTVHLEANEQANSPACNRSAVPQVCASRPGSYSASMRDGLIAQKWGAAERLPFGGLYGVTAQSLRVSRRLDGEEELKGYPVPAGLIRAPLKSIAGLNPVFQPLDSFGGQPREDMARLKIRVSERLRHKNRAVTPWDYERLVLERFPDLFMVKCFSALSSEQENRPTPGSVLVVVVPRLGQGAGVDGFNPMLSASGLNRIRDYLLGHASPFASIEVRNPVYERIQARFRVVFTKQAEARRGYHLAALNQAIADYISPWSGTGYKARFGWCIRRAEIEAYIRGLEYVEFVTRLSLLHITGDRDTGYALSDIARTDAGEGTSGDAPDEERGDAREIRPKHPWSLAVPVREQCIETGSSLRSMAAEPVGIDKLQVGQTFIING